MNSPLTITELFSALSFADDGEIFTVTRSPSAPYFPDGPFGMRQIPRNLSFPDIPSQSSPEPGTYLWSNNPEQAKTSDKYMMALTVTGSSSGISRDLGVNIADENRGRSLYLFFKPSGRFDKNSLQYASDSPNTGAPPRGIRVDKEPNALIAGKQALSDYHNSGATFASANLLSSDWFRINLGDLEYKNSKPIITGLLKLKFFVDGYLVLSLQADDVPPGSIPISSLSQCDPATSNNLVVRRNRGVFARRNSTTTLTDIVELPAASTPVSALSMNDIIFFTHHENLDTPNPQEPRALDQDWIRPTHNMPGDDLVNLEYPTAHNGDPKWNHFTPLQFQGNYQINNSLIMRVVNNYQAPIKLVLIAFPKRPDPAGLALYDVSGGRAIPTNAGGAKRRPTLNPRTLEGLRIHTYDVPSCSVIDLVRVIEVANGSVGRFYFALVPLVGVSSAGGDDSTPSCQVTSASTVTTPASTAMTSYTTSTSDTSVTTTGSTTGTGGTPNTNITPDTGVTPDSGTNSGSGTPVSSGTGTPITMVTNDTPVTPGPG